MDDTPLHILADKQPYGEHFAAHVPELIEHLSVEIGISRGALDLRLSSLRDVDRLIDRHGVDYCLRSRCFCALTAYVGEVLIGNIPSRWEMRQGAGGIWEPWVVSSKDESRPFFTVFARLDADEGYCPLEDAVDTELLILSGRGFNK